MPKSTQETARELNVTQQTLLRLVWDNHVTPYKVGRKTLAWMPEHVEQARRALAAKRLLKDKATA